MASLKVSPIILCRIRSRKGPRTRVEHPQLVADHLSVRQICEIQTRDNRNRRHPFLRSRSSCLPRCHHHHQGHHQGHHRMHTEHSQPGLRLHHIQPNLLQSIGQKRSRRRAGHSQPRKHRRGVAQLQLGNPMPPENLLWRKTDRQRLASRTGRKQNTRLSPRMLLSVGTWMLWISTIHRLWRRQSQGQLPTPYLQEHLQGL